MATQRLQALRLNSDNDARILDEDVEMRPTNEARIALLLNAQPRKIVMVKESQVGRPHPEGSESVHDQSG